jgi:hypothetical protein
MGQSLLQNGLFQRGKVTRKLPPYINLLMACVEKGIEPVSKDAMIPVDD